MTLPTIQNDRLADGDKIDNLPNDTQGEIDSVNSDLTTHKNDTSNPHSVTKSQVGLGSVDNTSDLNKPISTATQAALDSKQATLVSGTNIKTIGGQSVLGSGNLEVQADTIAPGSVTETELNTSVNASLDLADSAVQNGDDASFNSVQFEGGTGTQGMVSWNADEETLDLIQNGTTLQIGQETQYNVKNNSGSDITNGTLVMATGTLGTSGRITISPMDGTSLSNINYVLGIATEDIINGEDGKVTNFGKIRQLDTTGSLSFGGAETWSDGDILYVDTTNSGGYLTNVKPTSGMIVPVAFVIHSAANGTLFARITPINEDYYTTGQVDSLLSGKAGLTDNNTFTGVNTFSSSPIVPTPTTDFQAATKKYVDDNSGSLAVESVNGETGVVVLDADDIDDTSTTHKFTTASDIIKLAGIETNANNYSLPTASTTVLGGVKVDGTTITIDGSGVISSAGGGGGGGVHYVGQTITHGGGMGYDGSAMPGPSAGAGDDYLYLFRRNNGSDYWMLKYRYDHSYITFADIPRLLNYSAPTIDTQFAPKKYVDDKIEASAGSASFPKIIHTSSSIGTTNDDTNYNYTHNLGISQTDINNKKYIVWLKGNAPSSSGWRAGKKLFISNMYFTWVNDNVIQFGYEDPYSMSNTQVLIVQMY